ncbi:hypothetical protein RI367_001283 [Sorochytrium milnesiophthora]
MSTQPLLAKDGERRSRYVTGGTVERMEKDAKPQPSRHRVVGAALAAGAVTTIATVILVWFMASDRSGRQEVTTLAQSIDEQRHHHHHHGRQPGLQPPASLNPPSYEAIMSAMRPATNTYCAANTITAQSYQSLEEHGYALRKVIVVARHGDRAPNNVMTDDLDSKIHWDCRNKIEYSFLHDGWHNDKSDVRASRSDVWPSLGSDTLLGRKVVKIGQDSWKPKMWRGTCLKAELTERGRQQLVELGNHLRDIYVTKLGFLHPNFTTSHHLHVRATDIPRTIHSAQSLIEGLYPAYARPANPRPLSLHTHPLDTDPLHSNKLFTLCPRLAAIKSGYSTTSMWHTYLNHTAPFLSHVNRLVKLKGAKKAASAESVLEEDDDEDAVSVIARLPSSPEPVRGINPLTENLWCRRCWDKPLPCARSKNGQPGKCISQSDNELLHQYKSFEFYFKHNYYPNFFAPDIVRLEMGPLLHDMLVLMDAESGHNGDQQLEDDDDDEADSDEVERRRRKLHVYLAHDGTLSGLLGALQTVPEQHLWPSYRANIVIELWSKDGGTAQGDEDAVHEDHRSPRALVEPIVRILYDGVPLRVHNNWCNFGSAATPTSPSSLGCPLSVFSEFLRNRTTPHWEDACLVL